MKQVTIRECAIDALTAIQDEARAGALLLAMCREAFGDRKLDFDDRDEAGILYDYGHHTLPALYGALSPDIVASVREEPSADDVADGACEAIMHAVGGIVGDSKSIVSVSLAPYDTDGDEA